MKSSSSAKATKVEKALEAPKAMTEASITLFAGEDYSKKKCGPFHTEVPKLPRGCDNQISSCIVTSGTWILFHHPNFEGASHKHLTPGYYPNAKAMGIANNAISSIRPI